jgi:hypothetical protein
MIDIAFEWYENELKKEEGLKDELRKIHKRDEAIYFVKKCLYEMKCTYLDKDYEKDCKRIAYEELRDYIPLSDINKVILASVIEPNKLSYNARKYVENLSESSIPDSQYQVSNSEFIWEDLIYSIIGGYEGQ